MTVDVKRTVVAVVVVVVVVLLVDRSRKMRRHEVRARRLLDLVSVAAKNESSACGQSCNCSWLCWWSTWLCFRELCSPSAFGSDCCIVVVECALLAAGAGAGGLEFEHARRRSLLGSWPTVCSISFATALLGLGLCLAAFSTLSSFSTFAAFSAFGTWERIWILLLLLLFLLALATLAAPTGAPLSLAVPGACGSLWVDATWLGRFLLLALKSLLHSLGVNLELPVSDHHRKFAEQVLEGLEFGRERLCLLPFAGVRLEDRDILKKLVQPAGHRFVSWKVLWVHLPLDELKASPKILKMIDTVPVQRELKQLDLGHDGAA